MPLSRLAAAGVFAWTFLLAGAAAEHGHHWGYEGEVGPAHWGSLQTDYSACGAGTSQSPIDIQTAALHRAQLPPIAFHYRPAPLRIVDNGHTIQVGYAPGSGIDVGGHAYALVQFHFHRPSEERIDGRAFDMVAHLVHRDAEGHLAVVAVPLRAGKANKLVATLWANLPKAKEQETAPPGVTIDASDLLPAARDYYAYAGSLTTPPCTEGVSWFVLQHPTTLSAAEIERFARIYPANARPVQPLHGREISASR